MLLVEDVVLDAELVVQELSRGGVSCTVQRVETLSAFESALETFSPDLILADYSLPQFTALDLLDLLATQARDIPVIVVTGAQSEEVAVE